MAAIIRSVFRLLVLISCVFSFHGTEGTLTKTPQNVVVLRGQDATLNCSTDRTLSTGQNPITWKYDNDIISYVPCTSQHPGFVASPPDSATDCNIQALGSSEYYDISGVYNCIEQGSRASPTTRAVATVIVLDLLCEVVLPATEGLDATLMCRMTYEWQARSRQFNSPPNVTASVSWTGVSGTTVSATADQATFSGTVETTMPIQKTMLTTISSYNCTIAFDFSPGFDRFQQFAVNPVSYTCQPAPVIGVPMSGDSRIIGVVIGGVVGFVLLITIIIFIVVLCNRRQRTAMTTPTNEKTRKAK